jgi:hypothetical protein
MMLMTMIRGARNGANTSSGLKTKWARKGIICSKVDRLGLEEEEERWLCWWPNFYFTWTKATSGNTLILQLCAPVSCRVSRMHRKRHTGTNQ